MVATAEAPSTSQDRRQPAAPGSGRTGRRIMLYLGLVLLTLVVVLPLLFMLSTSLKSQQEATTPGVNFVPDQPDTTAYKTISSTTSNTPVTRWFVNSMIAATAHALLVVSVCAPAAYALARMTFRGKKLLFSLIVGTLFIPPIIFLMPNYVIVDSFGWIDTLMALIVPTAAGAFGVFFLRQFFLGLPLELEEAARIDGANTWQIFTRMVLPLSKPALSTLLLLSFLTNWNDFLWPAYVLFSPERLTLPPGLQQLQGAYTTNYPIIMAGGVIASAPVLLLYVFAQRYVIEGVSRSGIKG